MKIYLSALFIVFLLFSSCKYGNYINHDFRKTYTDFNEVLHSDTTEVPFFKAHFKNGDVGILEKWSLSQDKDAIIGQGRLYDFNRNQVKEGLLSFEVKEIAIIETNQLEAIKSLDADRVTGLAILTGVNLALNIFCISNPKACFGSCPTFYVEGETFIHSASAEGFSSSIAPSLEQTDIDALRYSTSADAFFLTMKNEALETHAVNQLQLHAVPKIRGESAFHDKSGNYYRCGELYTSKRAFVDGKDITKMLAYFDETEYYSPADSFDLSAREEIVLEFEQPPGENLGLAIRFRQTLLTTFLLYSGLSYMGDEVGKYFTRIETSKNVRKRFGNPFERLGKIELSVWDEETQSWRRFEELYETGPIAKNLMLAPLPKGTTGPGKLKIKIEMAKGLWRLDYVGLTNIRAKAAPIIISPVVMELAGEKADGIDRVKDNDDSYLIAFPGDEFRFRFELPELENESLEYELFLSSKGYYLEWIRDEWIRGKNIPKLKKMLLNDDQTWRELAAEYKSIEREMESAFWNSKYIRTQ